MALPQDLKGEDVAEAEAMDALVTAKQQIDMLLRRLKSQLLAADPADDGLDIPASLQRTPHPIGIPAAGRSGEDIPKTAASAGANGAHHHEPKEGFANASVS